MKLADLRPRLIRAPNDTVQTPAEASHIMFDCPKCRVPHAIPLRPAVSNGWDATGSSVADLTLSPSIQMRGHGGCEGPVDCDWHGWIRNGEVTNA